MTTAAQMIDQTKGMLQGWSISEEQSTTLSGDMGSLDLTFTVTDARGVAVGASPGIIEIDTELLYCDSVNPLNGAVSVVRWGRGYLSTTPAAHLDGARVISQPTYPRSVILDALNAALRRVYPKIFQVKVISTTVSASKVTYALPADAERILDIRWQEPTAAAQWRGVRAWRFNQGGITADSGKSVDIYDPMVQGRTLEIHYAARPGQFTALTDDFETVTGLNLSALEVITTGAAISPTISQELARLQTSTIEQQNRSQLVQPSAAQVASRGLEQKYELRLEEEAEALRQLYPPRPHRTRL